MSATRFFERVGGKRTVRPVSFRVSEAMRADGEAVAAVDGLTIGQLARQLLRDHLAPSEPAAAEVSTRAEVSTPTEGDGAPREIRGRIR